MFLGLKDPLNMNIKILRVLKSPCVYIGGDDLPPRHQLCTGDTFLEACRMTPHSWEAKKPRNFEQIIEKFTIT